MFSTLTSLPVRFLPILPNQAKTSHTITIPAPDFLKLVTYLSFFFLILTFYGLPLNILRDVYLTLRSFILKCRDLRRYRQATRNMDTLYPDAGPEEMAQMVDKTCIICREDMEHRGVPPPVDETPAVVAPRAGPNDTPKKLPCGHVFHFHCLRSWLERQQSCPTWYDSPSFFFACPPSLTSSPHSIAVVLSFPEIALPSPLALPQHLLRNERKRFVRLTSMPLEISDERLSESSFLKFPSPTKRMGRFPLVSLPNPLSREPSLLLSHLLNQPQPRPRLLPKSDLSPPDLEKDEHSLVPPTVPPTTLSRASLSPTSPFPQLEKRGSTPRPIRIRPLGIPPPTLELRMERILDLIRSGPRLKTWRRNSLLCGARCSGRPRSLSFRRLALYPLLQQRPRCSPSQPQRLR